ncbi:hypothetical protein HPB48_004364 [Haemaphysalis longicornis]|uniref:Tetraspanin n=1 Tax=Haemaphysalis longicornis TaxID=44386 RepID=A0A9J6G241_HAELO|nr:hypothetical protein HPB48_004364 [Haemaphysalis longicornis]
MLILLVVHTHTLYSLALLPFQPNPFLRSLVSKSSFFTLLMHPETFLALPSVILFFGCALGFVGALRESIRLLGAYQALLGLIILALAALCALTLAFPGAARDSVRDAYLDFVRAYRTSPDFQHLIDSLLASLRCCDFSFDSFRD